MTTEAELNIASRAAKTRMPFRVAAFALGILFVLFGLYQLFGETADWVAFGFAIFIGLLGLQFVHSAYSGQWKLLFAWQRDAAVRRTPACFLVVEPVTLDITETERIHQSISPEQSINPYAPPRNLPMASEAHGMPTEEAAFQALAQQFLDGHPFIHYGVVFFLEADDEVALHAALPLSSSSDILVRRNTNEAIRVLPEFLSALPNAKLAVAGRDLVVRMISSYEHLDDEVCSRIVVPSTTIHSNCEP